MDWTDCAVIEVVPGRMSGAPVVRRSRVRPEDVVANAAQGAEWIAAAHGLALEDVRAVLAFHVRHGDALPLEYISPERVAALGAGIDWSGCAGVEDRGSGSVISGTPVRPIDLVANRGEGEAGLAWSYGLPVGAVRSVLAYYERRRPPPGR